jgi:hypothetical protein
MTYKALINQVLTTNNIGNVGQALIKAVKK